ncbi:MAG: CocE/NonD family hydrolase [Vicinamibacterales bacterium]
MTDRRRNLASALALSLSVAVLLAFLAGPASLAAGDGQDRSYIRNHYTKYEHLVPMRDGVRLFTSVYVPKDKSKTYPIILRRTPYSAAPYGLDNYLEAPDRLRRRYFEEGYIVVFQDVRGRFMSEGEFMDVRPYIADKKDPKQIDETTDTYDTVEWLVKNVPAHNGRVGISGISYPGFYSSMGAIDAHPAVKAVSPQAPVSKWMGGDDFFHNGAFLLSHAFDFYFDFGKPRPKPTTDPGQRFDHGTPDGYRFFLEMGPVANANARYMKDQVAFWNEMTSHPQWDDFWAARDILPRLRGIRPAMLVVGGWFDTENLYGALHTYEAIEENNPGTWNILVMGPWSHGQWGSNEGRRLGEIDFGSDTSDYYAEHVELPFFNYYLKGEGKPPASEAVVFETGANEWRQLDAWPPKDAKRQEIFLQPDGTLTLGKPGAAAGCREYVSDPARPVPYTAAVAHWYDPAFMVEDQRFAAKRPDVLVYQTEPLKDDLRVAGPIDVTLFASTSGTDSDFVVKLVDVFPEDAKDPEPKAAKTRAGGYQMLVRGDVLRGKFRNSLAKPEPFKPGVVTRVAFELQDVFHRFEAGHRVMVQIQSTWFPMIDRNPQTFVDIFKAKPEDFQKATQRVCSDGENRSAIAVGIVPNR